MSKKESRNLVSQDKLPDTATLKKIPDLHREAELERIADRINTTHTEIADLSKTCLSSGVEAIERAISCGAWLRTVKTTLGHGHFEEWCAKQLTFKMRKAQYYMVLAHRHANKDLLRLQPQSLRQALIYAGALPEDTSKKKHPRRYDELTRVRRTLERLLLELRANEDHHPQELLHEMESLIQWRKQLADRLERDQKPSSVVDVVAAVSPNADATMGTGAGQKPQRDAFSPIGSEKQNGPHPAVTAIADNQTDPLAEKEIQDKVVAFRLSVRMRSALEGYHNANPVLGVRSAADLARKVVIDFIHGRLSYMKRKQP